MADSVQVIAGMSAEVLKAEELLRSIGIGEVVTYETLEAVLEIDVRNKKRYVVATARQHLELEAIVFEAVRKIGYKRLDDQQTVKTSSTFIRKARSAAKRGVVRVAAVADYAALPNDLKIQHNMISSLCATIVEVTKAPYIKKLRERVTVAQRSLQAAETLEHFAAH